MRTSRTIRLLVALLTGLLPVAQAAAARVTVGCIDPATGEAVARHACDMAGGRATPVVAPPPPAAHACCTKKAEAPPPPATACDLHAVQSLSADLPPCCVLKPGTPGGDAVPARLAPPVADRSSDVVLPLLLTPGTGRPAARLFAAAAADAPPSLRPPWRVLRERCLAARPPPASR